jgi:hypothetical protein
MSRLDLSGKGSGSHTTTGSSGNGACIRLVCAGLAVDVLVNAPVTIVIVTVVIERSLSV